MVSLRETDMVMVDSSLFHMPHQRHILEKAIERSELCH